MFSLGSPLADLQALRYIRHRYGQRSDDIVVSGSGLPVFTAVSRLLQIGVAPTRITVVVKEDEGFIEGLAEKNVSALFYTLLILYFLSFSSFFFFFLSFFSSYFLFLIL